jgi:hypothetical protein
VADDWLHSVNKELVTCECTNAEKIRFTAHVLEGPAAMWWETYEVTNPIEGLDWDTFREGFRNAHISTGMMNLKKDEFRTLKQGGRTMKEYMDDFCSLSRYAPEDINTDAKRKDKFLKGLKGELKIPLSVAYAPRYQALLDQAVNLDNNIRKEENCKRKFNDGKTHTEHSHKRHHSSEGNGNGSNSNGHGHNGGNKGNQSNGHHHGGNGNHNGGNVNQNGGNGHQNEGNGHQNGGNGQHRFNSGTKKDLSHITFYKCKKTRHFADMCPEKNLNETAKPNPFKKGHVNHINMEEVMGTFPLNSFIALEFI